MIRNLIDCGAGQNLLVGALGSALIVLVTFVPYPALRAGFIWDDDSMPYASIRHKKLLSP